MKIENFTVAFALCSLVIAPMALAEEVTRPITNAESILAVYIEDWGRPVDGRDRSGLVLAIWPDGHAVWSENKLNGGPPYRAGKVDPPRVAALLDRNRKDGLFTQPDLGRAHFGPGSHFTTLYIKSGDEACTMQSWHEMFESNGKIAVTDSGAVALEGQARLDKLREEKADYLFYRFVWSELQTEMLRLLPAESQPVDGHFERLNTGHTWVENDSPEPEKDAGEPPPEKK